MAFDYYNEDTVGPIGTFSEVDPKKAKYLRCFNKDQIALTHVNANLKQSVAFAWTPPADFRGLVVFR